MEEARMNTKKDKYRMIQYSQIKKEGLIIEEADFFNESVFAEEYNRIQKILNGICANPLQNVKNENCKSDGNDVTGQKINNIISIVGGRGTGKTSFMLSFLRILKENRIKYYDREDNIYLKNVQFIVLDYIDAGMLKSAEDIMSIVVAKMYQYLEKNIEEYGNVFSSERQRLMNLFDDIYKDLNRKTEMYVEGQSALRSLKNFSSSYSIGVKFRTLVKEYIWYLKKQQECSGDRKVFLVVALDDIDLYKGEYDGKGNYRGGSYELLEKLNDYFMIPGMVVVTSYNEQLLQRTIKHYLRHRFFKPYNLNEEHTEQGFGGEYNDNKLLNEKKERNELYKQFMEKVLPTYQVVFLPDYTKTDYVANGEKLKIEVNKNEVEWLTEQDKVVDVKAFVLRFIAYATGVYFDMKGEKKHFFEPRNLRDLHTILSFINMLCKEQKETEESKCRYFGEEGSLCYPIAHNEEQEWISWQSDNCVQLLQYIYNHLGDAALISEEQYLLDSIVSFKIERRCKELLRQIRTRRSMIEDETSPYKLNEVDNKWKYSYGELLRNIYYATRFQKGLSKEFIHCILASNTTILTRCYHTYISFQNIDEKKAAAQRLSDVLGTSVSGSWSNAMLPIVRIENAEAINANVFYNSAGKVGSVNIPRLSRVFDFIEIDEELIKTISNVKITMRTLKKYLKIKNILDELFLFGMFFTNSDGKGTKFEFEIRPKAEDVSEKEQAIKSNEIANLKKTWILASKAGRTCFNVLNFVVNSFQYESYFENFCQDLADAVYEWGKTQEERQEKEQEEGQEKDQKKTFHKDTIQSNIEMILSSVEEDYRKWGDPKSENNEKAPRGPFAIPFYQFDLTYNLIKRLADKTYYSIAANVESMNASEFGTYCNQLYEKIQDALKEQDAEYKMDKGFKTHFEKCPFIQRFKECIGGVEKQNSQLDKWLEQLAIVMVTRLEDTTIDWING